MKCHAHDFLAINMKLLLQTALLLLVGSASAFQNFAARYQAINTQLQAGYVPAGMTEKQYADYKKKEAQKAAEAGGLRLMSCRQHELSVSICE